MLQYRQLRSIVSIGNIKMKKAIVATLLIGFSGLASAKIIVGAQIGKSLSRTIETAESQQIEIEDGNHFALSVETTLPDARYGLFYAQTSSDLEEQDNKTIDISYLLFQSAVEFPMSHGITGYLGAQVGLSQVKPEWTESGTYFASGLYGGLEYQLTDALHLTAEARWLASVVNNKSDITCDTTAEPADDKCLWHFDGDLLNQTQLSAGINYRF